MEYIGSSTILASDLAAYGAEHVPGAATAVLHNLSSAFAHLPPDRAGIRVSGINQLRPHLSPNGAIGSIAARILGPNSRAVRAILFDKTPEMNWSLGWHQDRTICVKRRISVDGFGPWTIKRGMQHVAPPFEVLTQMVTLRVHVDKVPATNAPLLIAPGSHTIGRIPISSIEDIVRRCGTRECLAEAGDVWLYATPILHASTAASSPAHRRVLQVDFTAHELPGGLEWLGV
jgi:hypothetical protein